jgi:hypothetical protein
MPTMVDQRSGRYLGDFSEQECAQLMALLNTPPSSEEPVLIDPDVVERLAESGASERMLVVLQQVLQDREDFVLGWD